MLTLAHKNNIHEPDGFCPQHNSLITPAITVIFVFIFLFIFYCTSYIHIYIFLSCSYLYLCKQLLLLVSFLLSFVFRLSSLYVTCCSNTIISQFGINKVHQSTYPSKLIDWLIIWYCQTHQKCLLWLHLQHKIKNHQHHLTSTQNYLSKIFTTLFKPSEIPIFIQWNRLFSFVVSDVPGGFAHFLTKDEGKTHC